MDNLVRQIMGLQMSEVKKLLIERGERYGMFVNHAHLSQKLKTTLQEHPEYQFLSDDKKEALEMVMHKVARIVNGDPEYVDSWMDVIGYVQLVIGNIEDDHV